jgi:ribose 5-phosphate isomerase A
VDRKRYSTNIYFIFPILVFISKTYTNMSKPNTTTTTSTTTTTTDPYTPGKRAAARLAADELVRDGMKIGVGSGSTIPFFVERLAERVKNDHLNLQCVPTSFQARMLILEYGLKLADLEQCPELDVVVDGADECDSFLNCIKGGGGAQTQEKIVASTGKVFAIIADERKNQRVLGSTWKKGIPVEVLQMAYVPIMKRIEKMGGKPTLRMAVAKVGPCVTDNGNFILDCDFGEIKDPKNLNINLSMIPGVVETGLFVEMAKMAFFGKADGSVTKIVV